MFECFDLDLKSNFKLFRVVAGLYQPMVFHILFLSFAISVGCLPFCRLQIWPKFDGDLVMKMLIVDVDLASL